MAVFPYAPLRHRLRAMLGLGRALGETMAVAMVLSASGVVTLNLISSTNPSTIAANIALGFKEASGLSVNALIASGLVLFVITFAVNFLGRAIVDRRKDSRRRTDDHRPPSPATRSAARPAADPLARCRPGRRRSSRSWPRPPALLIGLAARLRRRRWPSCWPVALSPRAADLVGRRRGTPRSARPAGHGARPPPSCWRCSRWSASSGRRRQGRRRASARVLHLLDAQRRRRGRRHLPRAHRHAAHHRRGRRHLGPDRPAHGDLPGRVRRGRPAGALDHASSSTS